MTENLEPELGLHKILIPVPTSDEGILVLPFKTIDIKLQHNYAERYLFTHMQRNERSIFPIYSPDRHVITVLKPGYEHFSEKFWGQN